MTGSLHVTTDSFAVWSSSVKAGDMIFLSGTVFTARDAAHKRIFAAIEDGDPLPFDVKGAFVYYAGPTPAKAGMPVGSCGPTTSSRMDGYAPTLYRMGLSATIGKGPRSEEVREAIRETGALYLCAVGGAGALAAKCITSVEVIAYDDLGCESVKKMTVADLPLIVGIDAAGNSAFAEI
ncbi:MAG: fumarate hydratase C-terminal domain-containing protein [Clostridia bacterium]|nr:fumarate hydratase C-terminal domain-containing protein [Clostridia bacterium]